jgi:hypothetical protein
VAGVPVGSKFWTIFCPILEAFCGIFGDFCAAQVVDFSRYSALFREIPWWKK